MKKFLLKLVDSEILRLETAINDHKTKSLNEKLDQEYYRGQIPKLEGYLSEAERYRDQVVKLNVPE
jgi:hypothetical protein